MSSILARNHISSPTNSSTNSMIRPSNPSTRVDDDEGFSIVGPSKKQVHYEKKTARAAKRAAAWEQERVRVQRKRATIARENARKIEIEIEERRQLRFDVEQRDALIVERERAGIAKLAVAANQWAYLAIQSRESTK